MKLARMLSSIGILAALAGCMTWRPDSDDDRPMKCGSPLDWLDYGSARECFHPLYHCKPQDGFCDHVTTKRAAIKAANRALSEQNCGETSRDFRFGFQQAYVDIANGGSGALPAVPPPRYWAGPYRTTWGHNKARNWFSGYEAGVGAAKCCMPANTISVPTSAYRDCNNRLAVGLDSGPSGAAPIVDRNLQGFGGLGSGAMTPAGPMIGNSYPVTPYPAMNPNAPGSYSFSPFGAMNAPSMNGPAMNSPPMYGPVPFNGNSVGGSVGVTAPLMPSPMTNPPAMNTPYSSGIPPSGWPPSGPNPNASPIPTPQLPVLPAPYNSFPTIPAPPIPPLPQPPGVSVPNFNSSLVPNAPAAGTIGGGYSIPVPSGPVVNPSVTPMSGQQSQPPAVPQRAISPSNSRESFSGVRGFGLKPAGALR